MIIKTAKQLTVCQKSYALAMRIFEISRIRRFFCSVPVNLRKAWAQRRYGAHCVGKLTDGVGEANETDTSFAFARGCGYISDEPHSELSKRNTEIGKMPGTMTSKPELRSQKLPVCSRQAGQRFTQFRCFTQPAKCMKFVNSSLFRAFRSSNCGIQDKPSQFLPSTNT